MSTRRYFHIPLLCAIATVFSMNRAVAQASFQEIKLPWSGLQLRIIRNPGPSFGSAEIEVPGSKVTGTKKLFDSPDDVIGICDRGFFIIDMSKPSEPRFFTDASQWETEVRARGFDETPRLKTPEEIAYDYSDHAWAPADGRVATRVVLLAAGFVAVFVYGLLIRPSFYPVLSAAVLGVFVGNYVIYDANGPGFIVVSAAYAFCAWMGRSIAKRRRSRDTEPKLLRGS